MFHGLPPLVKGDKGGLKAFTLIELLIVMVIIGILSVLMFRSLAEMTRISGRIEFEKLLSQNLMTIHTTTSYLSEQYPHNDMTKYDPNTNNNLTKGYTTGLYLIANNKTDTATLFFSGNGIWLTEYKAEDNTTNTFPLIDEKKVLLTGGMFRILPTTYYSGSIYEGLSGDKINADGFRVFGTLYPNTTQSLSRNLTLNLQHFVHLKQ